MNKTNYLLIVLGSIFVVLGTIGVFVPVLPTTPFLLLAAACYGKGSKRLYNWLTNNRMFGKYIKIIGKAKAFPCLLRYTPLLYFGCLLDLQPCSLSIICGLGSIACDSNMCNHSPYYCKDCSKNESE